MDGDMAWLEVFFALMCGHALADFVLQPAAMGLGKNRHRAPSETASPHFPPWYYWLTAHALVHGGTVYLLTGSLALGLAETCTHWLIDFAKCEGWVSTRMDQLLHISLKLVYSLVAHSLLT